jgi:large repetitive protein
VVHDPDKVPTYDDRGLLLSASGTAGSSSLSYNGDGQVTSANDAAGTTGYSYDSAGRLATMTDPTTGATLTYSYNMDEVSRISYGLGGDTRAFGYNNLNELTSDTLATASDATVASIGYGYDPNGNLTSKTTTGFAGATTNTYTYDEANRLTSWNNGATTTNYAYDKAGNLTQEGRRPIPTTPATS